MYLPPSTPHPTRSARALRTVLISCVAWLGVVFLLGAGFLVFLAISNETKRNTKQVSKRTATQDQSPPGWLSGAAH